MTNKHKIEEFKNKIICEDCLKIMKDFPDNSIDLILTSPPYNLGIKYNTYNDNRDWKEYYEWCELWLKEFYRILKNDGRLALVHYFSFGKSNNRQAPLMRLNNIAEHIGFKHHAVAIWWDVTVLTLTAWRSWQSASSPYISSPFEGILFMYKNQWKKENKGKSTISKEEFREACSGIWNIPPEHNRVHPAPFPIKLAIRCINLLTYESDIVLDPFAGSGTTGLACVKLNHNYILIEINPDYCKMAQERIKSYLQQLKIF